MINSLDGLEERNFYWQMPSNMTFMFLSRFASVFGADSTQKCVYDGCVRPILNNILKGKNASVFAYGPTGAGEWGVSNRWVNARKT